VTAKLTEDLAILDNHYKQVNDTFPFLNSEQTFPHTRYWINSVEQLTGSPVNWRECIARHISATTALEGTRYEVHSPKADLELVVTTAPAFPGDPNANVMTYNWDGCLIDLGLPNPGAATSLVTAEDLAAEQFLRNARNALTSFQGGTFVGELGEAIHGIKNPAQSLVQYLGQHVRDAKRIRKRLRDKGHSNRRLNKVISDLWLERQYQWLPLVSDLENAAAALARLRDLEDATMASGEGFDSAANDSPGTSITTRGPFEINYVVRHHEESKVRFYGQVVAFNEDDPGPFADLLRTRLGLTLSDALPTAWELIPFSFVADYFSNLGSMISAYSFPTAAIRWMNRGILQTTSVLSAGAYLTKSNSGGGQSYEYRSDNCGSYKATVKYFLRTAYSPADLIPSLRLEIPGIGGWAKWLNLTALANSIRQ
jgi:hypothetical protein